MRVFYVSVLKKIEASDVFIFLGLVLIGTGLFFCAGLGISLTVEGLILFGLGFFGGAVKVKK